MTPELMWAAIYFIIAVCALDVYGSFREYRGNPFWTGYMRGRRWPVVWFFNKVFGSDLKP